MRKQEDTTIKLEGLEQAIKDFNMWQGRAVIMHDSEDNSVWCDVFLNDFDDSCYRQSTISPVLGKDNWTGRNNKTSAKKIIDGIKENERLSKYHEGEGYIPW